MSTWHKLKDKKRCWKSLEIEVKTDLTNNLTSQDKFKSTIITAQSLKMHIVVNILAGNPE